MKTPPMWKSIICLAKSRKTGGHCIAGRELLSGNKIGAWIRPISSRETEEISDDDCRLESGTQPQLLDIIKIRLKAHSPNSFQRENYLIDENCCWEKLGKADLNIISKLLDFPVTLWPPHSSNYNGLSDRVEECSTSELTKSLYLINPEKLSILVRTEGEEFRDPRRRVRAKFIYHNEEYIFSITDPIVERHFIGKDEGDYEVYIGRGPVVMCISIGRPWKDNYCYKFVASIIET
ncbi:MAG: hypothetical protein HQK56_17890 [Deltaproteobacteria bacterium]|nr:hypothetical protein [Deltaproteobacteria bacterium]